MFGLIVTGKEVPCADKSRPLMTQEGERFWVTLDYWGDTSSRCDDASKVPGDVKLFETEEAAATFAKKWKGHPWWCKPRGEFQVVKVEAVYQPVLSGYRAISPSPVD